MNLSVQQRGAAAPNAFSVEPTAERGVAGAAASPFAGLLGEQQRLVARQSPDGGAFAAPPSPPAAAKAKVPEHRPEPQAKRQDGAHAPEKNRPAQPPAGKDSGTRGVQPPAKAVSSKPGSESKRAADDDARAADGVEADSADPGAREPSADAAAPPTATATVATAAAAAPAPAPADPALPDPKAMLDWLARWGTASAPREPGDAAAAKATAADAGAAAGEVVADAATGRADARPGVDPRTAASARGDGQGAAQAVAGQSAAQAVATDRPTGIAAGATGDVPGHAAAADLQDAHALQAAQAARADHAAYAETHADEKAAVAERLQTSAAGMAAPEPRAELLLAAMAPAERRSAPVSGSAGAGELPALPVAGMTASPSPALHLPGSPVPLTLATPVNSPDFSQALASQLTTLARDGVHAAELQLHPADMGPIAVQIVIDGAQAQIDFTAAHAGTRQALETSLPALAAALNGAGLTLSGGGVFEQRSGAREGPAEDERRGARGEPGGTVGGAGAAGAATVNRRATRGLLDLYA